MYPTEKKSRFSIEPLEERIAPSIGLGLMGDISADVHASILGQTIDVGANVGVAAGANVSTGGLLGSLL